MFSENLSSATKLVNGLGLAIVGMGVVFTALVLISVALDALRIISTRLENTKQPAAAKRYKSPIAAPKPMFEAEDDLVAVIMAAVAAASSPTSEDFIVRSISLRQTQGSAWSLAGRQQQMKDRLKVQNSKGYKG